MKGVIKKQFQNTPKRKYDEKTQMTQMIGLIRSILTNFFPHKVVFEVMVKLEEFN